MNGLHTEQKVHTELNSDIFWLTFDIEQDKETGNETLGEYWGTAYGWSTWIRRCFQVMIIWKLFLLFLNNIWRSADLVWFSSGRRIYSNLSSIVWVNLGIKFLLSMSFHEYAGVVFSVASNCISTMLCFNYIFCRDVFWLSYQACMICTNRHCQLVSFGTNRTLGFNAKPLCTNTEVKDFKYIA